MLIFQVYRLLINKHFYFVYLICVMECQYFLNAFCKTALLKRYLQIKVKYIKHDVCNSMMSNNNNTFVYTVQVL